MHRTKAQGENILSTPENVRVREEAARCTAKIKRRVLRKQARKARAEHLVKCSSAGKKKTKSKPLTEYVKKSHVTEERNGKKELQRHCEEVKVKREELNISRRKSAMYRGP